MVFVLGSWDHRLASAHFQTPEPLAEILLPFHRELIELWGGYVVSDDPVHEK